TPLRSCLSFGYRILGFYVQAPADGEASADASRRMKVKRPNVCAAQHMPIVKEEKISTWLRQPFRVGWAKLEPRRSCPPSPAIFAATRKRLRKMPVDGNILRQPT